MEQKMILSDEKIQEIFSSIINTLNSYKKIPVATYRVQFNHQFKFSDAKSIVSYLHELGISDVYASPYFKAKKGSLHGYDILDHNVINPEIGSEKEYNKLIKELKRHGMGQILDIVPNHMSIGSDENQWWMDVLENGPSSMYAEFFDIDWKPVKDELENKVLLPILGDQYGSILENKEFNLSFEEGGFFIHYYDRKLPVAPVSYKKILKFRIEELEEKIGKDHPHLQELLSILTGLDHLPSRIEKDREKIAERMREKEVIKRRLWNLHKESREIKSFINENILIFNGDNENPRSFDLLDDLLNDQVYRFSHWRVATEEINYRRFFDINELAAIRMENPPVFMVTHRLIFKLIREEKVTGLRVDHPDGLYNPSEYFYNLQKGCFIQFCLRHLSTISKDFDLEEKISRLYDDEISQDPSSPIRIPIFIVGEKILLKTERVPEDWPILGTTGYEFLNSVNGLFINMKNANDFDEIYHRFTGYKMNYQEVIYEKKKLIMQTSMTSEVNMLGHYLNRISEKNRHTRDFTLNSLTNTIVEVIACFSVYRTYVTSTGVNERDRRYIEQAISRAKRKNPSISATVFDFLENILLLKYPEGFKEGDMMEWTDFVMRFQQITGPVMAKGVEDTVFYIYNRFISLNEVGGNPERFGTSLDAFHGQNIERTKLWSHAMITTTTHDTKRSEDVRARLNVLSEIPEEWRDHLFKWSRMNKKIKTSIDGLWIPDRNEECLLYQTLLGAWPLYSMKESEYDAFKKRIKEYMLKAAREAKVHTSWISPNLIHEEALLKFIETVLTNSNDNLFLKDFEILQKKIAYFGMFNSLSQTLLKITSPGIPDFFQGTEIWDFSLVDPDNRRPVNFSIRQNMLRQLKKKIARFGSGPWNLTRELLLNWGDGSIKLFVTFKALNYRKEHHQLFEDGLYLPLRSEGDLRENVCAFARQREDEVVIIIVPRLLTALIKDFHEFPLGKEIWGNSKIIIPEEASGNKFHNIFTGETIAETKQEGKRKLALGEIFANFPVALLEKEVE